MKWSFFLFSLSMKLFISFYILLVSNLFYAQLDSNTIKIWNQFSLLDDSLNYTIIYRWSIKCWF